MTQRAPARPVIPILPASGDEVEDQAHYVSMYQKRPEIYPRAVKGWFARWRWTLVWITQLFFYGMPWLQWDGRQALLFDLEAQRFYILGLVLYPQDLIFLAALLVLSALALFFFTAVAGRLWCGYACPQTVYTEIFMWVERRFEGDRIARMRLDQAPWSAQKLARKGATQLAWVAIGLFTGFSFVGYFTPIRELAQAVLTLTVTPWNLFWILFYGAATYGNAGFLREQMCKYMCPYARFQSALIDKDSLIITYDSARGDPRGSRSRKATAARRQLSWPAGVNYLGRWMRGSFVVAMCSPFAVPGHAPARRPAAGSSPRSSPGSSRGVRAGRSQPPSSRARGTRRPTPRTACSP